jgi:hypothetical protein
MKGGRRMTAPGTILARRTPSPLRTLWAGLGLALLALCMKPGATQAQEAITRQKLVIYGGPQFREFLGCVNCDAYEADSVWNIYSPLGWENSYSDYSHLHIYREPHGVYSACDPFASSPPRVLDPQNRLYGYLNISKVRPEGICAPHGNAAICDKLTAMCEKKNNIDGSPDRLD